MGKREKLIAYATKYDGDYFKITDAIQNDEEIEELNQDNCLTILDELYPKELLYLKYPPLVLFYKGNINLVNNENIIGVVGSRNYCEYAKQATEALIKHYKDRVVVSGLAKGIDGIAHRQADVSIGVLGCGINYIYPYSNLDLYKKLEETGLIISEYPDKVLPLAYHFPFRNRLIAALSSTLYVMQSSEKSGTVTTINEALNIQKEVKVLPYSIFEKDGKYNNQLINDGALLIDESEIIIDK